MNRDSSKRFESLRRDKWLLLLCFVLGFLSWQGIRKNTGFEVTVPAVALEVDLPEGWAVWERSVQQVNILFRGSREDLRYLNSGQLRMVVPIDDPKAGQEMRIRLESKYLKNPTRAKVVRFSPSDFFVKLDRESDKLLPVKAATEGTLPEGTEIEKVVCIPASVRVYGSEQVLSEMVNIHTEPVKLDERGASFKESVPIALPQLGRMRVEPEWVSVDFTLEQHASTKTFEQVPVRLLCSPGERRQMTLQPKSVQVAVKGQQQRIEQLRVEDIFAYVNCADLTESTAYDLPVAVRLPAGLKLVNTTPATLQLTVEN